HSEELVDAAHSLLGRGIHSYSLGELSTHRGHCPIADVEPLFLAALRELGIDLPTVEAAAFALASDCIWKMAEGVLTPSPGLYLYWWYDGPFARIKADVENLPCFRELAQWYYEYDDALEPSDYVTEDDVAEADREVVEAAVRWVRSHGLDRADPSWLSWNE